MGCTSSSRTFWIYKDDRAIGKIKQKQLTLDNLKEKLYSIHKKWRLKYPIFKIKQTVIQNNSDLNVIDFKQIQDPVKIQVQFQTNQDLHLGELSKFSKSFFKVVKSNQLIGMGIVIAPFVAIIPYLDNDLQGCRLLFEAEFEIQIRVQSDWVLETLPREIGGIYSIIRIKPSNIYEQNLFDDLLCVPLLDRMQEEDSEDLLQAAFMTKSKPILQLEFLKIKQDEKEEQKFWLKDQLEDAVTGMCLFNQDGVCFGFCQISDDMQIGYQTLAALKYTNIQCETLDISDIPKPQFKYRLPQEELQIVKPNITFDRVYLKQLLTNAQYSKLIWEVQVYNQRLYSLDLTTKQIKSYAADVELNGQILNTPYGVVISGDFLSPKIVYILSENKVSQLPDFKHPHERHCMAFFNNSIYAISGFSSKMVEVMSAQDQTWNQGQKLPFKLYDSTAISTQDSIYVFGGQYQDKGINFNKVLRFYDGNWEALACKFPSNSLIKPCLALLNSGQILVFGGKDLNDNWSKQVFKLDCQSMIVENEANMPRVIEVQGKVAVQHDLKHYVWMNHQSIIRYKELQQKFRYLPRFKSFD